MIENKESSKKRIHDPSSTENDQPVIVHIPVKGGKDYKTFEEKLNEGDIHCVNPNAYSDNPNEAAEQIAEDLDIAPDDSLVEACRCAGVWRSLGAETFIYISSYGASQVANGLFIRFLGANVIMSSFLCNLAAVIGFQNARILFNSLLRPPIDEVSEDQQKCFEATQKYGLLPISWAIRAVLSATSTAFIIKDTSFEAQQLTSAITSAFVGPIMYGARKLIHTGMKGTQKEQPRSLTVTKAFSTAYSRNPNEKDDNRPYAWGTARDLFIRTVAMSASTMIMAYMNGFQLQTYCIDGQEELNNISQSNRTITFDDVNENCLGGPFTFYLRDMGIAFIYGAAMLILEPILNTGLNRVFDYFVGTGRNTGEEDDDDEMRVEEVPNDERD